ncbi:MAG: DNA-directed RNA polymerase subunit beta' [Clostridiales bacterium]|jgi:DNA-directed RNA polymerase subunit beta'|nr:DNA-directed RNA polymerase subunit beta' [Clostridiales bacterium]
MFELNNFDSIQIGIASPEKIREWSYGEVTKPETINYRTQKPEKDGLFCERIFGPTKDWECHCGKYKRIRYRGVICDKCGVEVTRSKVRRERMGHIELAAPVSHIWYFRGVPSRIGLILDMSPKALEQVLYFAAYIVLDPGDTPLQYKQILIDREYREVKEKYGDNSFKAGMGAEAIKELLQAIDLEKEAAELKRALTNVEQKDNDELIKLEVEINLANDVEVARRKLFDYISNKKYIRVTFYNELINIFDEEELSDDYSDIKPRSKYAGDINRIKKAIEIMRQHKGALGQKRLRLIKRIEIIEAFRRSGNRPEWMILDVLPAIPPELRPMVQLDGGRFATSDLNDLYRRVINRNNRLKRLIELGAPDIIVRNEKRMLQEAVDALIDNGRRGKPITGPGNRELKSLSGMLRGKQGRFRQNLLGKRVDYSGRSVIVVGPELKLYQCGVPKEMALELFKPFVMKKLVEMNHSHNIKSAKRTVERAKPIVWDVLEEVIKDHPVLLNRAPTLHRLSIQAFEPVLIEGRAIKLHPLVCGAFNADFDGDQMAVHVPLSIEAQAEARFLMLASNNILKPSDGKPVVTPTQDMVIGCYYMTIEKEGAKGEGKVFKDPEEAVMAYQSKEIELQAKIKVRREVEVDGKKYSKIVETTVGKILFNEAIPQDLGFVKREKPEDLLDYEVNFLAGKKQLQDIVDRCYKVKGASVTAQMLDKIKEMGFKYSTVGAITTSVFDLHIPPEKKDVLKEAEEKIMELEKKYKRGLITGEERYKSKIDIWNNATNKVAGALKKNLDKFNPIWMMANSGARGNMNQIRQLAGMRGLMSNPSGKIMEVPVKTSFREGLSVLDYFISSHGGRKGLADTALKTADSGYLTRRLVDVAQEVIVRDEDCYASLGEKIKGIEITAITGENEKEIIESLADRIEGRFAVEDIINPETGEVIVGENQMIGEQQAKLISKYYKSVKVRSVLTCRLKYGVCAKCYGKDMATGYPVQIGEAVGIIAAQSIGEPGTQLTMRTFHTGGVASSEDITQGLPRVEELFEARKPKGMALVCEYSGKVAISEESGIKKIIIATENGNKEYAIPFAARLKVKEGDVVEPGTILTVGSINPHDILKTKGVKGVQEYLVREVQSVYRNQGVEINDKHIEIIVRQMLKKVKVEDVGDTDMLPGELADINKFEEENEKVIVNGGRPATAKRVLLGITKASLATDSFLAAASFQETARVLTEAAIKNKVDPLIGLKENVIIGKLIPAGTGLKDYKNIYPVTVSEAQGG